MYVNIFRAYNPKVFSQYMRSRVLCTMKATAVHTYAADGTIFILTSYYCSRNNPGSTSFISNEDDKSSGNIPVPDGVVVFLHLAHALIETRPRPVAILEQGWGCGTRASCLALHKHVSVSVTVRIHSGRRTPGK